MYQIYVDSQLHDNHKGGVAVIVRETDIQTTCQVLKSKDLLVSIGQLYIHTFGEYKMVANVKILN